MLPICHPYGIGFVCAVGRNLNEVGRITFIVKRITNEVDIITNEVDKIKFIVERITNEVWIIINR